MKKNTFYENLSVTAKEYFSSHNVKPSDCYEASELVHKFAKECNPFCVTVLKNNKEYLIDEKNYYIALFPDAWYYLSADQKIKTVDYAFKDIYNKLNLKRKSNFMLFTESGTNVEDGSYDSINKEILITLENILFNNDFNGIQICALLAHELNHQRQFEKMDKILDKNKYNRANFVDKHMCGENIFFYYAKALKIEKFMDEEHRKIYKKLETDDIESKRGNFVYSSDVSEVDSGRIQAKYTQKYLKKSYEAFGVNYLDDKDTKVIIDTIKEQYSTEEHKKNIPDDKFLPKLSNLTYWTYKKYEFESLKANSKLKIFEDANKSNTVLGAKECAKLFKYIDHAKKDEKDLQIYCNAFVDLMSNRRVPKNFDQRNFNKLNSLVKYFKENEKIFEDFDVYDKEEENER